MKITSIVKKEYYDHIVMIDLNEISHIEFSKFGAVIVLKNSTTIEMEINEKDTKNDLKTIILDIYSSWKKYAENISIITQMTEG